MQRFFLIVIVAALALKASGQPDQPGMGVLYADHLIPRFEVLIDQDSLDALYENPHENHEYPATFVFKNGYITDTVENVGFRFRGNTSLYANKKSFRVSFNTFEDGRSYRGVEKLDINGQHNDPSVIRSKLAWDTFREMGIPAPRSNHVEMYINGEYYGIYINEENIDEKFTMKRFGNNHGNLYKCTYPADLDYIDDNPEVYKMESDGERVYELKNNHYADDYSDLAEFIKVLNQTPLSELSCALDTLFNVQQYLKVMAVDVYTGNWDGYIYNKNNFYLYHNQATGRFEYIPYDVDNTFGISWQDTDWKDRNIYEWSPDAGDEPRPLYNRILQVDKYRDQFSSYYEKLVTEVMPPDSLIEKMGIIKEGIRPFIQLDPLYPQDYGFTMQDFDSSYYGPLGAHVKAGLKPFFEDRAASGLNQLEEYENIPVFNYAGHNHPRIYEELTITVRADNTGGKDVVLVYRVNDGSQETKIMWDDGAHNDGEANDGIFGCTFEPFLEPTQFDYQVKGTGSEASLYPCAPLHLEIAEDGNPELYINEFMASNATFIEDPYGEYDDWFEIYNGDDHAIWLGDKYVTDDFTERGQFRLPDYVLEPSGFVLIWADNDDEDQGFFHAPFRLRQGGEQIGIFGRPDDDYPLIDKIAFGQQQADSAFGRLPNGADNWEVMGIRTPGYSNTAIGVDDEPADDRRFAVYPNPVSGSVVRLSHECRVEVYSMTGQLVKQAALTRTIDVNNLKKGVYIIRNKKGETIKLMVR
ncbi:MAG: CotH kinase family protein [Bacteroidales bacterium]|nr:CotH kinase family protein [Bacteroidales bacterium]MCF8332889.1 CotH kinase family protein [Bacteroidales bacterium]